MNKFECLGIAILLGVWELSFKTEWLSMVAGLGSVAFYFAYLWKSEWVRKND